MCWHSLWRYIEIKRKAVCVCIMMALSVPPPIPNIDITKRWQVTFRARPLYPRGRNPSTHLSRRVDLKVLKTTKSLVLSGIELRLVGSAARSSRLSRTYSQLHIKDTVDTTNLSLWEFRQSTVRANTQYRWVWTECQIDMLGTKTAFTRREVDEHRDCPRYSVRTRDRQYNFHSQPETDQNLKPIGMAEPLVNTRLKSKRLRTSYSAT